MSGLEQYTQYTAKLDCATYHVTGLARGPPAGLSLLCDVAH